MRPMKYIVLFTAMLLCVSRLVIAEDNITTEKDWCLLGIASKCSDSGTIDLFDKIKRLEKAIQKGLPVYTAEEIKQLKKMLEEANDTKELMNRY